jgi:capsule polysaccharide export protein KpsE/RkpR
MVEVELQPDVNIITLNVLDYDAVRARELADTIITESERFMNQMSDTIREQTLRAARQELQEAETQAATAPASQRDIAERRLSAAQVAMATALSLANSQQVFVVRISNPTLPTETTRPQRLLDLAAVATLTAVFYAIFFMIMSNVRDHRRL